MPFAACPLTRIVAMVDRVAGAERRCAGEKKSGCVANATANGEATMLTMSHAAGANEPAVRDITLGELLQWAAETTPNRVALITGVPDKANRRQWTYAELYTQSVRTARALRARFEPGERVAIWAHNIPEWIMVECGAAMAGVILVTVNPAFRSNEVEYVLKQSRSAGILVVTG